MRRHRPGLGPASRPSSSSRSSTDLAIGPNTLTSATLRCVDGIVEVPVRRNDPEARLVPVDAAERRRHPDRATDVGADLETREPHRHRGRRARPRIRPGVRVEIPRIAGGPEDLVVALVVAGPPRHVRLAEDDGSGISDACHDGGVVVGNEVTEFDGTARRAHTGRRDRVLHRDRHARQQPEVRGRTNEPRRSPPPARSPVPGSIVTTACTSTSSRSIRRRWASSSSRADTSRDSSASMSDVSGSVSPTITPSNHHPTRPHPTTRTKRSTSDTDLFTRSIGAAPRGGGRGRRGRSPRYDRAPTSRPSAGVPRAAPPRRGRGSTPGSDHAACTSRAPLARSALRSTRPTMSSPSRNGST